MGFLRSRLFNLVRYLALFRSYAEGSPFRLLSVFNELASYERNSVRGWNGDVFWGAEHPGFDRSPPFGQGLRCLPNRRDRRLDRRDD